MLAGADTLRRSEHVRVDALYGKLSERTKCWIDIASLALIVIPMSALIGYLAVPMFVDSFVSREMSNDYGGLIRYPAKFLIPAGFFLIALQAVSEIIKTAYKLRAITTKGV
jgi:TRAP-type mannitol/chloroaromatic compound transport system permease small subunit